MNRMSAPPTSLRLDVWTDDTGEAPTVQVAISTNSETSWIGTEAQFLNLFCTSTPGQSRSLNQLCDSLNLLWANAKFQSSTSEDEVIVTRPMLSPSFR